MMESDKDREIRELRQRLDALEGHGQQAPQASPPPKKRNFAGYIFLGVIGLLAVGGFAMERASKDLSSPSSLHSTKSTWMPPTGYDLETANRGGAIGVEWSMPTSSECRGSGVTCFAVNVVTEKGCSRSLYASVTILNASGDNIGWTNDSAQGVRPEERVRLVFKTYERNAKTARIAEINCY